jgi:hypothetical protein
MQQSGGLKSNVQQQMVFLHEQGPGTSGAARRGLAAGRDDGSGELWASLLLGAGSADGELSITSETLFVQKKR